MNVFCQRCSVPCKDNLCDECTREWTMHPYCSKCNERCWNSSRGGHPKKPYLYQHNFLCSTCWNNRLIPDDSICPRCLHIAQFWNKSFGMCTSCAKKFKAENIRTRYCSLCRHEVTNDIYWRWHEETKSFCCPACYNGNERRVTVGGYGASSRRERRIAARRKSLPKDLKCPRCLEPKPKSSMWVVKNGVAVCKGCYDNE